MADAEQTFRFAQFEFPWVLGPANGRYVLRDEVRAQPRHVLVIDTLGAPERRVLTLRRARPVAPEPDPTPVTTTRATLIAAVPLADDRAGAQWLAAARRDPDAELDDAVDALNRAVHAHGIAAADGLVREVRREHALVSRLGWGRGEQVAEGKWADAIELPPPSGRRRRAEALRPQERLASMLGGRDRPLAAETLTLRARVDLDAGRDREAALQLRVALEAALAELEGEESVAERLEELRGQREVVGDAANAALRGPLDDATREGAAHVLARLEAAFRARALSRLDAHDVPPAR
ncbi:MAG: hypothetical protein QOK04_2441 [Solirubrobacteraceae bacterium]|nr:hypothetical protein [Solirubrobacteraceae bacterium]